MVVESNSKYRGSDQITPTARQAGGNNLQPFHKLWILHMVYVFHFISPAGEVMLISQLRASLFGLLLVAIALQLKDEYWPV